LSPNVAAHADAGSCDVRANHDGQQLIFEVEDDGRGIPDHHRLGMGRESMRERAEELGGNLTVTPNTSGSGTMVGPCCRALEAQHRQGTPGNASSTTGRGGLLTRVSVLNLR